MTTEERNAQARKSVNFVYRLMYSDLRNRRFLGQTTVRIFEDTFTEKYLEDVKITELGRSTTLVEIPSLDHECLLIGGNEKYIRTGCLMYISIYNSEPMELSRERVQERLDKLGVGLELYQYDTSEEDNNGEYIDVLKHRDSDSEWEQGDNIYIPQIVPEGKALMNRNKEHYGWLRLSIGRFTSIDKEMFELLSTMTDDTTKCTGCNAPVLGYDLCPLCRNKYRECDDCGKTSLISEGEERRGSFLCGVCKLRDRCKGCGYPVKKNGDKLCERCGKIKGILDYHSRLGRQDESGDSKLRVGIEVEKEDIRMREDINYRGVLRDTGWIIERDNSLGPEGFEMVSPVYPLDIDEIEKRIQPLLKELGSRTTVRCGGHIHVSDTERTPHEILLDIRGYLPLLYGLYPQRATNEYCEAKETPEYIQQGHRQALNITTNTLEFRIFPAIKNTEQLLFRLRLVEYMLTHKETDVVKVGELLLDKGSELHKLLRQRISEENLKVKAKAFIDFTNYLDRDALVLEGDKIKRVISIPKIKLDKTKAFEERVKAISDRTREEACFSRRIEEPLSSRDYGYLANLTEAQS